jgi:hypothetical protein
MLRFARPLAALSLLVPFAAACGGATAGSSTSAPDAGPDAVEHEQPDTGTPDAPPPDSGGDANPPDAMTASLEGSYDITFGEVKLAGNQPGGPTQPPTSAPSPGTKARLDLHALPGGGYEAVVTARWNDPGPFSVVDVSPSQIRLSGSSAAVRGASYVDDEWTVFAFSRAADGTLDGSFTATGEEDVTDGDETNVTDVTVTGTVARDVTAPEFKPIILSTDGPPGQLLPWDPIRVRAAEPIAPAMFLKGLTVSVSPPSPVPSISWTDEESGFPSAWAGTVQVKGLLTSWDSALTNPTLGVGGMTDRVGNASAPMTEPLSFLTLLPGQTSHEFDTDTVTVGSWGPAITFLGGFAGSDPSCEKGGCVQMGAFSYNGCLPMAPGVAGLLAVPGAKAVLVRYRVLANGNPTLSPPPGSLPILPGAAFTVAVATPGVDASPTYAYVSSNGTSDLLKPLASPVLGMNWATDWTTLTAPVATPASVVGFSVTAGMGTAIGGCGGAPAYPRVDVIVLVDSVSAQ